MKTDSAPEKKRKGSRSLRARLTFSFILFAVLLMAVIWIMQTGFLEQYYEIAMEKRAAAGMKLIGAAYSYPADLDLDEFCDRLADLSSESDLYFYIEAVDGTFTISSNEQIGAGRMFMGGGYLTRQAIQMLGESQTGSVSFIAQAGGREDSSILVNASLITSEYRDSIYLVSVTPLTPLGPAVGILSSQLKIITVIALFLGCLIAFFYSKRLAKPVIGLKNKAQELARGNYDVDFDSTGYAEIEDLGETLNQTARELAKADDLQKDLLANISHDLRTPLTMIKSYAELIRDISGENKERRDEHLQVIIEETDRLSDLVGDILALSKLQAGTEVMENQPVDIQKSAESILNVYRVLEEQDGFKLTFTTVPGRIWVMGDERKLQQVMSNLISNSIKYSGDSKDIEVAFSEEDGRIKFSVTDHGIGIADEDKEVIWDRYQKASRQGTRVRGTSTGLGLSIAREILQLHHALYGVVSELGKGSCFWFSLPIAEKDIEADDNF
ncbi:MAG: HAMP domain-containing histidine kinase [Firmicutes bacterium]|nr:HAMP domain-containing histidine kinase [Bacillota bacterium]